MGFWNHETLINFFLKGKKHPPQRRKEGTNVCTNEGLNPQMQKNN